MNNTIPESELILNADGSIYHLGLRPEHLTGTILAVGDPDRVPLVSRYFDKVETIIQRREFNTHIGDIGSQRLMVISSGMGTDNVEILLTELDALANIDFHTRKIKEQPASLNIVRIGTSGSLQEVVPLDSHLVSDYAFGLDTLMQFYPENISGKYEKVVAGELAAHLHLAFEPYAVRASEELKEHVGVGMIEGNTLTCPGFYAPQGRFIRNQPRYHDFIKKLSDFRFRGRMLTNFEMETAGYYAMGKMLGHQVLSVNAVIANRLTHRFSRQPQLVIDSLVRKVLERLTGSS